METGKKIAAGVLPICSETGRMLLIKRGPQQSNPGMWACFGGKFEPEVDKSPKDTAKREFAEESMFTGKYNISRTPLYVNSSNHSMFYTYVGIFGTEFIPDLESAGEADEFGWFSIDELPENLLGGFNEAITNKSKTVENIICFYTNKC
jgi:ADP-ribose pyrophosphatase YjhB (NUDIX family)